MINASDSPTTRSDEVQMLTVAEVAKRLRISVRGVWRLNSMGELPKPVYLGRLARWHLPAIKKWMEQGCPSNNER